jgi:hypothetical protein
MVSEDGSELPDSAVDKVEERIKSYWRIVWMGVEG